TVPLARTLDVRNGDEAAADLVQLAIRQLRRILLRAGLGLVGGLGGLSHVGLCAAIGSDELRRCDERYARQARHRGPLLAEVPPWRTEVADRLGASGRTASRIPPDRRRDRPRGTRRRD